MHISDTLTAAAIMRAVQEATGLSSSVEMTGGHVATIYVGRPNAYTDRYALVIGPGSYDYDDPSLSTFDVEELFLGPDDDGDLEADQVRDLRQVGEAARRWQRRLGFSR